MRRLLATFGVIIAVCVLAQYASTGIERNRGGESVQITTQTLVTDQLQPRSFINGIRVAPVTRDATNNPVLGWGAGATWDDTGVRDPHLLIDEDGQPVIEGSDYVMYYRGYEDLSIGAVGRATSPDRVTWTKEATNPVFELDVGEWDADTILGMSVMKLDDGSYVMWYASKNGTLYGIGRATSPKGIVWTRYGGNPILTHADFTAMNAATGCGLGHVLINNDGDYIMVFEASVAGWSVLGATSSDGITFTALNGGNVLFGKVANSWESYGVANPWLHQFASGEYLLAYNGTDAAVRFSIGFAKSSDLINWTRYPANPVLVCNIGQVDSWELHRIEGAALFSDDFGGPSVGMLYFGLQSTGSVQGRIGYATINQTATVGRVGSGLVVSDSLILGPNANQAIYSDGTNLILQSKTGEVVRAEYIFGHTEADTGDGNPATYTLTPTVEFNRIGSYDADGLTLTLGETGVREGMLIHIMAMANGFTMADVADVQVVVGAEISVPVYGSVWFRYYNPPGTSSPQWYQVTTVCAAD